MQMRRQAGYGGRVLRVNPMGGTIFGYESVTSIAMTIHMVDSTHMVARLTELTSGSRTPLLHSVMAALPGKTEWLACAHRLRDAARSDNLSDVRFRGRRCA